jgi:DNA-binding MarR family transcriptional regulator
MPNARPSIAYLIHRIAVRIEDSINAKARKYRLRVSEIRVLMRLLNHGDLSVGQLAEMTSIEPSALSHLLRRLDKEGLISRTRYTKDNRLVFINLTQRGKKFASTLQPHVQEYNYAAEKGIKAEQLELLYAQLDTIYTNIIKLESLLHDFPDFDLEYSKTKRPARTTHNKSGTKNRGAQAVSD